MTKPSENTRVVATIHTPLSDNWEKDKKNIKKEAEKPTLAINYYNHAHLIQTLFNIRTYDTPAQPNHPQRKGLLRDVHDELFPIAHFANQYFTSPENVVIQWVDGNQQHDATVKYIEQGSNDSDIHYLEVTTLQGKEDADELKELSEGPISMIVNRASIENKHNRKITQLVEVLKKKAVINYPDQTALLIYTDEDRIKNFHFGPPIPEINKKEDYKKVLQKFKPLIKNFSHIFIYSKNEIYCTYKKNEED